MSRVVTSCTRVKYFVTAFFTQEKFSKCRYIFFYRQVVLIDFKIKTKSSEFTRIECVDLVKACFQDSFTDVSLAYAVFLNTLTANKRSSGNCHSVCFRWVCVDVVRSSCDDKVTVFSLSDQITSM